MKDLRDRKGLTIHDVPWIVKRERRLQNVVVVCCYCVKHSHQVVVCCDCVKHSVLCLTQSDLIRSLSTAGRGREQLKGF